MRKILVSIIVPVYKVEEYLMECVDSILLQTYENYELILVDDGSPDFCGTICDEYAQKDMRIRVIHKKNGGLSDARNTGMSVARGEYITFIDSDDYVDKDYVSSMLNIAIKDGSDIVQCEFTQNAEELGMCTSFKNKIVFNAEQALKDMLGFGVVQVNAWAKLYKRELFKEVSYPVGRINEDNLTTYKLLDQIHKMSCISQKMYFYRTNPKGIMNSEFSEKRYEILSFSDEITEYLGIRAQLYKPYIEYAEMRIAIHLYNKCITTGSEKNCISGQKKALDILKKYKINRQICEKKYKILIGILRLSKSFYGFCVKKLRV